jgi:hypothetical protein
MYIFPGAIRSYTAEENIKGGINNKLNAVKLVTIGSSEGKVKESKVGDNKFQVLGAVATIGPGSTVPWVIGVPDEADINEDDMIGVGEDGIYNLILKADADNAIEDGDLLKADAEGGVSRLDLSATATNEELMLVVATARVDLPNDAVNDRAVEAELLI